jgi:Rrf2 family protein
MSYLGSSHEYSLHCLLWLVEPRAEPPSVRDLADLQGVSPTYLAKIFTKLEKAGIVHGSTGVRGGFRLARSADAISVLDVVEALDGKQPLFDCQHIRGRCAVFGGNAPDWSTDGVCAVHAVMLRAEKSMRDELARATIGGIARALDRKAPDSFSEDIRGWLGQRRQSRAAPRAAQKQTIDREA